MRIRPQTHARWIMLLALVLASASQGQPGTIERILRAPDGAAHEQFGASLDVLGTTVAVGAPFAAGPESATGACYVFDAQTGELLLKLQPDAPEPFAMFGHAVALTPTSVLVGAPDASVADTDRVGKVYVFDRTTGEQTGVIEPEITQESLHFGHRIASNGSRVVITAAGTFSSGRTPLVQGRAWLFDAAGLAPLGEIPPPGGIANGFGVEVTMNDSFIAIGMGNIRGGGYVVLHDTDGGFVWRYNEPNDVPDGTAWGANAALSGDDVIVPVRNLAPDAGTGAAQVRVYRAGGPAEMARFSQPAPALFSAFGSAVSATEHALIVGSYAEDIECYECGAAFIYSLPERTLLARVDGIPSDRGGPRLGTAIDAEGGIAAVAAMADDQNGAFAGAVYIIRLPSSP
ncbi:MAG: hypothetical protein AAFS11_05630 [Planctomycetota bacterium]